VKKEESGAFLKFIGMVGAQFVVMKQLQLSEGG
jgi:hypothetical protein